MTKNDLADLILICIADAHQQARNEPEPARWRKWDLAADQPGIRTCLQYGQMVRGPSRERARSSPLSSMRLPAPRCRPGRGHQGPLGLQGRTSPANAAGSEAVAELRGAARRPCLDLRIGPSVEDPAERAFTVRLSYVCGRPRIPPRRVRLRGSRLPNHDPPAILERWAGSHDPG